MAALMLAVGVPVCPTARVFHIPCPGCGLSRATRAMLTGHLADAYHLHPLAFVIVPTLGLYVLGHAVFYVFPNATWVHRAVNSWWMERFLIVVFGVAILLWIARFFGAFGGPVPV